MIHLSVLLTRNTRFLMVAAVLACAIHLPAHADPTDFFEKRVRPVLAAKCLSCHSGSAPRGGLHLDSASDLARPMRSGKRTVVPGSPEKSALVLAITGSGPTPMPPGGRLSADEISAIQTWIKSGAVWPAAARPVSADLWSLKPVQRYSLPPVSDPTWPLVPFDRFIFATLSQNGLKPSPPADRRTLCRRAYYDVTGLPPTAAQITAFVTDTRPDAWQRLVDGLLADRGYGERWGRLWLDIARYSDTVTELGMPDNQPSGSHSYRDWVIRSLNADLPYDKFLKLQIAAGAEGISVDKDDLAACGFLTLGRRFGGNQQDVIDDQIDVIMRGTQALTVTCARCHDHKFDPVPMADYYSLTGILSSCTTRLESLTTGAKDDARFAEFNRELTRKQQDVQLYLDAARAKIQSDSISRSGAYLLAAATKPAGNAADTAPNGLEPQTLNRWRQVLENTKGDLDPIFTPWHGFAALKPAEYATKGPALAKLYRQNSETRARLNWQVAMMFSGAPPKNLAEVATRYQRLFADVDAQWQRTLKAARQNGSPPPSALPVPAQEGVRQVFYSDNGALALPGGAIEQALTLPEQSHLAALRRQIIALQNSPASPDHAFILADNPSPANAHILLRGDSERPGEEVPRRYLAALSGTKRHTFTRGSGRAELAEAIASPDNPLTARVFVNRAWMHLFGEPIVKTPGDFGSRGEAPSNPALLDWLALDFVDNGWSIKHLIRTIMLSQAYQMRSDNRPECASLDPENRLIWRQNRKRLDFEEMRDSLLAAGGEIDRTAGGAPFDVLVMPYARRRTVYGNVDRDNLPPLFRVFDFANPDTLTPQRYTTISPQQALFFMNSPFSAEQAIRLAHNCQGTLQERINALTMQLFGRAASAREIKAAGQFAGEPAAAPEIATTKESLPVWQYGWGKCEGGKITAFHPLRTWTGQNWAAGPTLPDPELGSMFLSSTGGAPGGDKEHAIIRRWVAPADCTVSLSGSVKHAGKMGDGIVASVVSSATGVVASWKLFGTEAKSDIAAIPVHTGDTIDFVVECGDNDLDDNFTWAPILNAGQPGKQWSAASEFAGPHNNSRSLTAWERFVQTMLCTNEFAFVD